MLDKDYIDQMGKKYDYFTYYIKFKKACFHLPTPLKKKKKKGVGGRRKVSDLTQRIIIFPAQRVREETLNSSI